MYAEVTWVLVSLGTQIQLQIIIDPDYLSNSYDYDRGKQFFIDLGIQNQLIINHTSIVQVRSDKTLINS